MQDHDAVLLLVCARSNLLTGDDGILRGILADIKDLEDRYEVLCGAASEPAVNGDPFLPNTFRQHCPDSDKYTDTIPQNTSFFHYLTSC